MFKVQANYHKLHIAAARTWQPTSGRKIDIESVGFSHVEENLSLLSDIFASVAIRLCR